MDSSRSVSCQVKCGECSHNKRYHYVWYLLPVLKILILYFNISYLKMNTEKTEVGKRATEHKVSATICKLHWHLECVFTIKKFNEIFLNNYSQKVWPQSILWSMHSMYYRHSKLSQQSLSLLGRRRHIPWPWGSLYRLVMNTTLNASTTWVSPCNAGGTSSGVLSIDFLSPFVSCWLS